MMIILRGWCCELQRQASSQGLTVVLEQGPVNMLARLWGFGSNIFRSQSARTWWDCTCDQWADTLDLLVWLDASVTTLVRRVRTREKWSVVKELPDQVAFERLACNQAAISHVVSLISSASCAPRILHFDTVQKLPDQICDELVAVLWQ
jgi:hypothetical protein